MVGNGNGNNCEHALVNLALICRSLLANNGLAEPAKAEAEVLLEEWRHLGGRPVMEEDATECGQQEWALLRRMEAFLAASAAHPAGPVLVHR
jgi:hypothetical protein